MKPTPEKVKAELRRLRALIESTDCPIESKIAWAMEQGIRWATEETVGWPRPSKEATKSADCLKAEMARPGFAYPAVHGSELFVRRG